MPIPRRSRARLVLSEHPRRGAARELGEVGPHEVILQLHDVGLPRSRDLFDGTRELGTRHPGDCPGVPRTRATATLSAPPEPTEVFRRRPSAAPPGLGRSARAKQGRLGCPCGPAGGPGPHGAFLPAVRAVRGGATAAVSAVAPWGKRGEKQAAAELFSRLRGRERNRVLRSDWADGFRLPASHTSLKSPLHPRGRLGLGEFGSPGPPSLWRALIVNARGESRTRTGLPPADFESAASAIPPLGRGRNIHAGGGRPAHR